MQSECNHRAHLLVECGDLSASFGADNKGSLSGAVHLWRLEAVEQLPAMSSDMASSTARLHEVSTPSIMRLYSDGVSSGDKLVAVNVDAG